MFLLKILSQLEVTLFKGVKERVDPSRENLKANTAEGRLSNSRGLLLCTPLAGASRITVNDINI